MAAYKYYAQTALKTEAGTQYLVHTMHRVFANALFFADGNVHLAVALAEAKLHQRYQPALPSFQHAGRARRGALVSCFLLQITEAKHSIGRAINSALELSRIGGGVG